MTPGREASEPRSKHISLSSDKPSRRTTGLSPMSRSRAIPTRPSSWPDSITRLMSRLWRDNLTFTETFVELR
jgi:hypothetical protein